jgi:hypothetical protein
LDTSSLLTIDLDSTLGQSFKLLNNDGTDTILGGFANGSSLIGMFGGNSFGFAVRYNAGSGNDVAIFAVPELSVTFVLIIAAIATIGVYHRRGRKACQAKHPGQAA